MKKTKPVDFSWLDDKAVERLNHIRNRAGVPVLSKEEMIRLVKVCNPFELRIIKDYLV